MSNPSGSLAVLCVLLIAMLGAGCFEEAPAGTGGFVTDEPAETTTAGPLDPADPGPGAEPPRNQTDTRVKIDPNRTFIGGAHQHDWWSGDSEVTIMDKDLPMPATNVCVGADIVFACSLAAPEGAKFVRFNSDPDPDTRPNIVFPGTGRMEIKITHGQLVRPYYVAVQGPGGFSWAKDRFLVDKTPFTITLDGLTENNTDPPHFRTSSYVFRLEKGPDVSVYVGPVHWTVRVFRDHSRELPIDPPHPDFWEGATSKILLEHTYTVTGCTRSPASTGTCPGVTLPDNSTITIGASKLRIDQSWTNTDPVPTKLKLNYCAPGGIACTSTGASYSPAKIVEEGASRRVYEIEIRPDQWDSPYSKRTSWTFQWAFDNADGQGWGRMTGTISWKFELFKME